MTKASCTSRRYDGEADDGFYSSGFVAKLGDLCPGTVSQKSLKETSPLVVGMPNEGNVSRQQAVEATFRLDGKSGSRVFQKVFPWQRQLECRGSVSIRVSPFSDGFKQATPQNQQFVRSLD